MRRFYHQEIKHLANAPALRTFQDWLSFGAKFARIAAGGTIYCLLIICGLHLRSAVRKVHGRVPSDVASILRRPLLADSGVLVSSFFTVKLIVLVRLAGAHHFQNHSNNCKNARRSSTFIGTYRWSYAGLHVSEGL